MMSMKNTALCIGVFAIIMGWVDYDPEIETAAVPFVTGIIVVILALLGQIPEMVTCELCGIPNRALRDTRHVTVYTLHTDGCHYIGSLVLFLLKMALLAPGACSLLTSISSLNHTLMGIVTSNSVKYNMLALENFSYCP